jgi:competence protein ComEA
MPQLSRSQAVVYGAVALALLLVGVRALRAEGGGDTSYASDSIPSAGQGGSASIGLGGGQDVVVDVAGAVRRPGVYRMPAGARVTDAVERAGGPSGDATLEAINLAARLSDGQQVLVPGAVAAAMVGAEAAAEDAPIGLGGATVEQLETIDGIGPVTAQKIIEYREAHGGLASVEQLDDVSGIGPATMESLRSRLQP